jgi:hypothetical protein
MGMEPDDFFLVFVLGNCEDFREESDSVRRAFNAATAAFQLADHVHAYFSRKDSSFLNRYPKKKQYLQYLESLCGDFIHVQSVATVYKHLYADGLHYTISSGGSVDVVEGLERVYSVASPAEFGTVSDDAGIDVSYTVDVGNLSRPSVAIMTRDGQQLPFLPILENVVSMWSDELITLREPIGAQSF